MSELQRIILRYSDTGENVFIPAFIPAFQEIENRLSALEKYLIVPPISSDYVGSDAELFASMKAAIALLKPLGAESPIDTVKRILAVSEGHARRLVELDRSAAAFY